VGGGNSVIYQVWSMIVKSEVGSIEVLFLQLSRFVFASCEVFTAVRIRSNDAM
jgi:hypothetical protein